ncbi:integrase core domain-containing protein [Nonomuraea sp. KM90]|uniref:integrase core domain-containing protein n=1 Tax=Nonomuraea sp. KM90 TaxID=3457428 RepID=UPI003FCE8ED3
MTNTDTDTTKLKFLIRGRGGQLTDAFDAVSADAALRVIKSPPQAPKLNAHRERIIGTLRRELLDRVLILTKQHLRRTLSRYLAHYNTARPSPQHGAVVPIASRNKPTNPH